MATETGRRGWAVSGKTFQQEKTAGAPQHLGLCWVPADSQGSGVAGVGEGWEGAGGRAGEVTPRWAPVPGGRSWDHGGLPEGLAGGDRDSICDMAQVKREGGARGRRGSHCHGGEEVRSTALLVSWPASAQTPLLPPGVSSQPLSPPLPPPFPPPLSFQPPLPLSSSTPPSFLPPPSQQLQQKAFVPGQQLRSRGSASASLPSSPGDFLRSPCTPASLCAPSQAWGPSGSGAGPPELSPDVMDFRCFFCLGCRPVPAQANRAAVRGPQTRAGWRPPSSVQA